MRIKLPKLLQNSVIYSGITILQKGISFFLLPLYTAFLTPGDYGIMNVVTSLSSLVSLLILLGLSGAGTRFTAKNLENENYIKSLWGAIAAFVLLNSIVIGSLFICFHKFLLDPIAGNISFYPYLLLGLLNVIVTPLYLLFQDYLRGREIGIHYGINTLLNFLLNTFLIIYFVVVLKLGVIGVLLANLITSIVFFIYVLIAFIPKLKLSLNKELLKPSFKYSLPLIPHLLAGWSSGMIDRLLLNGLKNEKDTGLYSVANQFGNLILVLVTAFNSAYTPWFFRTYDKKQYSDIRKVVTMLIVGVSFVAFVLSFFAPEVLRIMVSEEFREVWTIIPLLCFAYVFQCLYCLFGSVLFLEKTNKVFIISVSTMCINIVLNIWLIPLWGYVGSAIACFISFFIKSLIALVLSRKYEKMLQFKWILYYFVVFFMFFMTFSNHLFLGLSLLPSLLIKVLSVAIILMLISVKYHKTIRYYFDLIIRK